MAPSGSPAWQNGLSLGILTNNRVSGEGYDAAGNMTGDGFYSYSYDAEERQTSAAGVTYGYDGDGNRVVKSNATLYWHGGGKRVLADADLSGNWLNEYLYYCGKRTAQLNLPAGGRGRERAGSAQPASLRLFGLFQGVKEPVNFRQKL